jgi:hypothetical protein
MIGARVLKTSLAVSLSVLTARTLDLHTPLFAGIVSVLSVQPSIFRSFRLGIQQTMSAAIGSVLGALTMYSFGTSFFVVGLVTLILMAIHVKLRRANMLLISVVCAINTMGAADLTFLKAAGNEVSLVLIGVGIGTLVNCLHKPKHHERAEDLIRQSEAMLRALLHFMCLSFKEQEITSYPIMREQIDQVREYIERGKEISRLMIEDKKIVNFSGDHTLMIFRTLESCVERIRDMSKALQGTVCLPAELAFSEKAIALLIKMQERKFHGRSAHMDVMGRILEKRRRSVWTQPEGQEHFESKLAFYNFYGFLHEYLRMIDSV